MLDRITPVVLTLNEEPNIGRTLENLRWAREVVVVDSGSTDRTVAIIRSFHNVRMVERQFDNHAGQWTFALSQVHSDWLFTLDADYAISAELIDEIKSLDPDRNVGAFETRFTYLINGRPVRGAFYPPKPVLLRKSATRFVQDGHKERRVVSGEIRTLRTPIGHDDRKPLNTFVATQKRYMKLEAEKIRSARFADLPTSGKVRKLMIVAPPAAFLYALFGRGAILDGRGGVRYATERLIAESILSAELFRSAFRRRRG